MTDLDNLIPDILDSADGITVDEAYIKREVKNFRPVYSVYDAQGELLAYATTRQEALRFARRNDLIAQDVQ